MPASRKNPFSSRAAVWRLTQGDWRAAQAGRVVRRRDFQLNIDISRITEYGLTAVLSERARPYHFRESNSASQRAKDHS